MDEQIVQTIGNLFGLILDNRVYSNKIVDVKMLVP